MIEIKFQLDEKYKEDFKVLLLEMIKYQKSNLKFHSDERNNIIKIAKDLIPEIDNAIEII